MIGNLTETINDTMDYVEQAVAGGEECDAKKKTSSMTSAII